MIYRCINAYSENYFEKYSTLWVVIVSILSLFGIFVGFHFKSTLIIYSTSFFGSASIGIGIGRILGHFPVKKAGVSSLTTNIYIISILGGFILGLICQFCERSRRRLEDVD